MAPVVNCHLHAETLLIQCLISPCVFVVVELALGQIFLPAFRFSLSVLFVASFSLIRLHFRLIPPSSCFSRPVVLGLNIKVKQSRYRPLVAQRVPGS
jgi:hypothetical protein